MRDRWDKIKERWEEEVREEAIRLFNAGLDPERALYHARINVRIRHQNRARRVGGSESKEVRAEVVRSEEVDRRYADWGKEANGDEDT
mgnify:CR=1 FL=1